MPRCGLTRGSEVTDADQQRGPMPQGARVPATAPKRPGWQRWLRYWWIPALGIALLVGWLLTTAQRGDDGSLTSAGNVSVDRAACRRLLHGADEEEISDVDGVPCDESHEYEVFAVRIVRASTYPTEAEFEAIFSRSACRPSGLRGHSVCQLRAMAPMITPSEESWGDGDRSSSALLYDPNDAELTESLEGANR